MRALVASSVTAAVVLAGVIARAQGGAPADTLEEVARFDEVMPTGVTVSRAGRVFVCVPRWEGPVPYTVAELVGGQPRAYPDPVLNEGERPDQLISVQSVVVDPDDRLWLLDTGSIDMKPVIRGGPKLVGVDLDTDEVFKVITFPDDVVLPTTYLNDVRFDLRGDRQLAFITDSGVGGIIVVDLETGSSWRKLHGHPAVLPEPDVELVKDGRPLRLRLPGAAPERLRIASDGVAITEDRLLFCALTGQTLYSVPLELLADESVPDAEVAAALVEYPREFASDGLESDDRGRIYMTDLEHAAVRRLDPATGEVELLVQDPRLTWPDTLALSRDGWLYVMSNQLHRMARFNEGVDRREPPHLLLRLKLPGAQPASLK